VGENVEPQLLLKDFDAVVVCTGATLPRGLAVEGHQLQGVHFAMDYLTISTQALLDGDRRRLRSRPRARTWSFWVVVTRTDCVGTAMRQGCRSLLQAEILPQPPMDRAADNPWPEWPRIYKLDYGQEEAAAKFGSDPRALRDPRSRASRVTRRAASKKSRTVQIAWEKNATGAFIPVNIQAPNARNPRQLVLLRHGFLGPEQPLLKTSASNAMPAATSTPSTASSPPT